MAGKKSGRRKGDVWNLKVYAGSPLEHFMARDAFQSVINILRAQPLSGANGRLIMFMSMVRDSVRMDSGGAAGAESTAHIEEKE